MSAGAIEQLIDQLNQGDAAAAEKIFRTYEPYLRMLVTRQIRPPLRAKFDSMDVVQSVWADVLEGMHKSAWHFKDGAQLRAFLVRLAQNRFLDRCRKHRNAMACEAPLPPALPPDLIESAAPRPSEVAQHNDAWDRMLALCPPAHHELLRLKRQGLSVSEIAAKTRLHEGSVRRILYDLARRYAGE